MPMGFLVRNYARVVRMPLPDRGWDGGEIATRALDEPRRPGAA